MPLLDGFAVRRPPRRRCLVDTLSTVSASSLHAAKAQEGYLGEEHNE